MRISLFLEESPPWCEDDQLTEGVTVASIAKVRDKDPEADTTTEKADGETGDNEEGSSEEAVTGSEEE